VEAITPGWRSVFIGLESTPVKIKGFELWKHEWEDLGETIVVAHPSHPHERHTMFVYRVAADGKSLRFAAGEYSNGVWGFHEPVSA
jgi:hypothetical protein